jgi:hypothetical protein
MDEDWWRRCNRWEEEGREKEESGKEGQRGESNISEKESREGATRDKAVSDNRDQESGGLAG